MTVKIVRAVQTCAGLPSQWDAWDEAGQYYYLRFRHGYGSVRREPSPDTDTWHGPGPGSDLVASFEDEDPWAGIIDLDEFCQRAGIELELTAYQNFAEHLAEGLEKALADLKAEGGKEAGGGEAS